MHLKGKIQGKKSRGRHSFLAFEEKDRPNVLIFPELQWQRKAGSSEEHYL